METPNVFMNNIEIQRAVIEAAEKAFSDLLQSLNGDDRDLRFGPGGERSVEYIAYLASKCYALYAFLQKFSVVLPKESMVANRLHRWLEDSDLAFSVCPMCNRWYPQDWFSDCNYRNSHGTSGRLCLKCEKATTLTEEPFDPGEV